MFSADSFIRETRLLFARFTVEKYKKIVLKALFDTWLTELKNLDKSMEEVVA